MSTTHAHDWITDDAFREVFFYDQSCAECGEARSEHETYPEHQHDTTPNPWLENDMHCSQCGIER